MENLTKSTLYIFVNCCREKSRYDVAKQVITTLNDEQRRIDRTIESDLVVFDNGSTYPGSVEMLKEGFPNAQIFKATVNEGYWSALCWVFDNLKTIRTDWQRFKYVHVIESDHTYYALEKLADCEVTLDDDASLGSVRLQEYSINDRKLYDKTLNLPEGKRYAWVSHINHVTKEKITFGSCCSSYSSKIYPSNFLTCLHSLNRLDTMIEVFDKLGNQEDLTENQFQKMYHDRYPRIGVHDGGILHAKLGFTIDNPAVFSGSWSQNLNKVGYKTTRVDRIMHYSKVEKL